MKQPADVFSDVEKVRPDEVVRPTRVTWTHQNKMRVSRVFPTQERAWEFAADKPDPTVQDASEPVAPPPQATHPNRFRLHVKYARASSPR